MWHDAVDFGATEGLSRLSEESLVRSVWTVLLTPSWGLLLQEIAAHLQRAMSLEEWCGLLQGRHFSGCQACWKSTASCSRVKCLRAAGLTHDE